VDAQPTAAPIPEGPAEVTVEGAIENEVEGEVDELKCIENHANSKHRLPI